MHSFRTVLAAASEVLLDPASDTAALSSACTSLYTAALRHIPKLSECSTPHAAGSALSPADAARCLLDPMRTASLARGVRAAIERAHARERRREARVLYAGCGPLAPLLLAVAHRYPADALQVTLVDLHAESIAAARDLFVLAGVQDRLAGSHCADATTLVLDPRLRPDVLVVEILQQALQHEPQVAVLANLAAQCAAQVQIVPACIRICAWLGDPSISDALPVCRLATLLELTRNGLDAFAQGTTPGISRVPLCTLHVGRDAPTGLNVMLTTQIENGAGEILSGTDSGLTRPLYLFPLGTVEPNDRFAVHYRLGRDPGFELTRIAR